jgi:CRISPR type I-E-associated protein CasB/Cse2
LGRLGALGEPKLADAITATLYAENPHHQLGGSSLGKALLRLAGGSTQAHGFDSFERHFRRLLACNAGDLEEVGEQLHRLFKRLERENISLDYNRLLWDLRSWRNKSEDIKTRWARDFWQAPSEKEMPTP